jgi:membrane-associated protease RseP (regulator of RpoE activity)
VKSAKILLHLFLFIFTFFTVAVAGVQWRNLDPFDLKNFTIGIPYAISVLLILGSHEFGHYLAARYHGIDATLPFFIPFPNIPGFLNFGTLGAVIRTKSAIPSKKVMFDIGVAGPLAGFVVTLLVLIYGFMNLPGKEFILSIHPDYFTSHVSQGLDLRFGGSLLYDALSFIFTDPTRQFVPPMSEMYHYPFLCAGWFGLFITAMNLIPVGQLDGGHLAYTMFGSRHRLIARISFTILMVMGIAGFLPAFGIGPVLGWSGWIFWGLILFFIIKLDHPPVIDEAPLDPLRVKIGWITFFILLISFSPSPFSIWP